MFGTVRSKDFALKINKSILKSSFEERIENITNISSNDVFHAKVLDLKIISKVKEIFEI